MTKTREYVLPLKVKTPDAWGTRALEEPLSLLNDHAHLERKAATNALDLLGRWPEGKDHSRWVRAMTSIARDEIHHFAQVVKLLERRGRLISRGHKNNYAQELRDLVRLGQGDRELADRLFVSALIELRSCERFEILSRHATDPELAKLYKGLWTSEHGHYKIFLDAASHVLSKKEVELRWHECLIREAQVIARQTPGARMHAGW